VKLDAASLPPLVTWGTSPEQVISITGRVPVPADIADDKKRSAAETSLAYMGLKGGEKITDIAIDRVFHRLLHQRPARGPARPPPAMIEGKTVNGHVNAMVVPGSGIGEGAGGGRRPRQDLPRRGLRMARAGLLDVSCDEPRQARAGRALRLDVEPQFRGPPGLQGPHPSGLARDGGGGSDRRQVRRRAQLALSQPNPSQRKRPAARRAPLILGSRDRLAAHQQRR